MSGEPQSVHIDFKKLLEVAYVGVRRAAGFMTLGLRAATDPSITSLNLVSNFSLRFFPEDPGESVIRETQRHYSEWIIGNGLRELEQYFSAFVDELYLVLCLIDSNQKAVAFGDISKRSKRFNDDTNLASKLDRIAAEFNVRSSCAEHFSNISRARNVLTHNLGIVSERHQNSPNGFRMTWRSMDMRVGDKVISQPFESFRVEKDEVIALVVVDRERTFPVGTSFTLTSHDLSEICMMFSTQASELVNAAQAQAVASGIIVQATSTTA